MIDANWDADNIEIDLVDENAIDDLGAELEVVEGSLDLPPDLVDDVLEGDQIEHLENALDAQGAAEAAIEVGDYQAAAELREVAEAEIDAAGTGDVLDGATALELEYAAEHQENATELEAAQADAAQSGDYSEALDLSREAELDIQTADELAGGSDHSGQAQLEVDNMEWAEFHQEIADDAALSATEYAEAGNLDGAENAIDLGLDHQAAADHYGDLGEHGGEIADFDPSSYVETNHVDTYSAVDTDLNDDFADTSTGSTFEIDTTPDPSPVDFSIDTTSTDDFST